MDFSSHQDWDTHRTTPLVVGIAGGSGSGKSVIASAIATALGNDCAYLQHDRYYHPLDHLPMAQRHEINFDAPNALETDLLATHLRELRHGRAITQPNYDFSTHTRQPTRDSISPDPFGPTP